MNMAFWLTLPKMEQRQVKKEKSKPGGYDLVLMGCRCLS